MFVNPDVFFRLTHGGEEARMGGYMMNPNELGMLAGIGVAGLLFDLRRNHAKWWTIFKLVILFFGLYATGSRSSLIGALLIIGFHVYLISEKLQQYAISETQKYGHVTFFWNGNKSGYLDRNLETFQEIPSDVIPFDQAPEMKAKEITDTDQ